MWSLFSKKMLGIDIGTASIKVAEVSRFGKSKKLENYGELKTAYLTQGKSSNGMLDPKAAAEAIRSVMNEARITTKRAVISIPDFFTFCTSFDIPTTNAKEIHGIIQYNASQYITLPIAEVTLDWQVTPNLTAGSKNSSRVFLVAVPNQVVEEYKNIARMAGLDLYALEAEVFGITRSLIKDPSKTVCLIDVGAESSTINIVDRNSLERSYSFNFGSNKATALLAANLKIDTTAAEQIKQKEGLASSKKEVTDALISIFQPLVVNIKNTSAEFTKKNQRPIEEYYLTGGTANMPGLKDYFLKNLSKPILIPNYFAGISHPKPLEKTLQEMSPGFSAAIGVALGGLETI